MGMGLFVVMGKSQLLKIFFSFLGGMALCVHLSSCGVSGALPQASVPLPENDPITISSPSNGFVVVAGAESAVPNDSVVEVTVSSPSASLNFKTIFQSLIPQALAAGECSSDLPACPTLSDGSCQTTANSDGSFEVTVPADLNDTVSVNYLDADNECTLTEGPSGTVQSGVNALGINAVSMTLDRINSQALIFGTSSGETVIAIRDASDGSDVTTLMPNILGDPTKIDLIEDVNNNLFLVMQTSTNTQIAPYSGNAIDANNQKTLVADVNDNVLTNLTYLAKDSFVFPPANDAACLDFRGFFTGQSYTRALFNSGGTLYILDSVEDFSLNLISNSGNLIPRAVTLTLTEFPNISVVSIPFIAIVEKAFVVIAGFSDGSSSDVTYYALQIKSDSGFCSPNLDLGSDTPRILMGVTSGHVFASAFQTSDESGNVFTAVGLLQVDDQIVKAIDATKMESDDTISVPEAVAHYESDGLNVSDVVMFVADERGDSGVVEIFLLGTNNGGGGFVASDNSATQAGGPGTLVNAIDPVGLTASDELSKLIILDAGLSGVDQSNLILLDVSL